jgi:uncharacterized cupin superfamily protein
MADVTVKRAEDFEAIYRGGMLRVRSGLGVSAFGIQLLQFPPHTDSYPEHDHSGDGQEEVYIVLEGVATLQAGGEEHRLEPGVFARVGPGETRKLVTGDEGAKILALGGTVGKAFERAEFTDEGQPDPAAG